MHKQESVVNATNADEELRALEEQLENDVMRPLITKPSREYYILCGILAAIFLFALFAWSTQLWSGLIVTGLNAPVFWGVYIVNFVFFIGISHAGTLISSILRIANVEWRRPFTRMAEAVTIFSLPFGALCPIVDMGRPDRVFMIIKHPHITSPILWDIICISTYLTTSLFYFHLSLVPDIALARDRLKNVHPFKHWLYKILSMGWTGTERQWRILNTVMTIMSVMLFVIVISVHTNVSFVFAVTFKPGWHTTILPPFFVLGAIFSGIATVIVVMAAVRKYFGLGQWITDWHFDRIAAFLLALTCFWFYAMFVEHLLTIYLHEPAEMRIILERFVGRFSLMFWVMFALCFIVPLVVLSVRKWRTIPVLVIVSLLINVGMWLERYIIIVPSNLNPLLPWGKFYYFPSWVEIAITAGWFAGFMLLLLLFARFFPTIAIWEVKEGLHAAYKPQQPVFAKFAKSEV
ncbi:MAG: polysulfide reductase NrfD [Armatimonadetes bacterium]|nr:polysulfide reductase NrfD [Armatimonadota bacterium]